MLERADVESSGEASAADEIAAAADLMSQAASREENAYRAMQACNRAKAKARGTSEQASITARAEEIQGEAEAFIQRRFDELEIEYRKHWNLKEDDKAQDIAKRMMDLVGDPSDDRYIKAKDYLGRSR